jgi:hypothetical protein
MTDEKKPLPEADVDPLTLVNLILNHDARKQGLDWVHYGPGRSKSQEEVFTIEPPKIAFVTPGVFIKDDPVPVAEAMAAPSSAATSPTSSQQAGAGNATPSIGVEANNLNPTIKSSDPKFNPCPAYLQSMCRIDGRPCPYSAIDYKECGKYYLAGSGDPELFEISPGREQSQEYQIGIKA